MDAVSGLLLDALLSESGGRGDNIYTDSGFRGVCGEGDKGCGGGQEEQAETVGLLLVSVSIYIYIHYNAIAGLFLLYRADVPYILSTTPCAPYPYIHTY